MTLPVIEFLLAGFTDNSGEPLASGKVYTYDAGTTTPKDTYTDSAGVTPEANPIILDSNGRKHVYASGSYKLVVKTSADVTLYTFDNLFFGNTQDFSGEEATNLSNATARSSAITYGQVQDGIPPYSPTVGGSANAITITPPVALTSYVKGRYLRFAATSSNTSAVTVNVSSLGVKNLKKQFGAAEYDLVAGDVIDGGYYEIFYDGTQFLLLNPSGGQTIYRRNDQHQVISTASETTLASTTILGGTLGTHGRIRVKSFGQVFNDTGSNQDVTWRVNFGGITFFTYNVTLADSSFAGAWELNFEVASTELTTAQRSTGHLLLCNTRGIASTAGVAEVASHALAGYFAGALTTTSDLTLAVTIQLQVSNANLHVYHQGTVVEFL